MTMNRRQMPLLVIEMLIAVLMSLTSAVHAANPVLAFSDMISGPNTGLGDGRGSGAIVTVWGYHLGTHQSDSNIYFIDASGQKHRAAYVYYWKNADGALPSGPANLFASHNLQEIAFSIPASATGAGNLAVEVAGTLSNLLPFAVRAGNIYHVMSSGSDSNAGTYAHPWRTIDQATRFDDRGAPAGSTLYVHDVNTGSATTARAIFWRRSASSSSLAAQFTITAYPGFRPTVTGQIGVEGYRTEAMVVSKLDLFTSDKTSVDTNDQPVGARISDTPRETFGVHTTKDGRVVANRMTDIPGGCADAMSGAIVGGQLRAHNAKILGNEIYEYGCAGSDKLHHTTYMTIRSNGADHQIAPWEFGYNYLHDNHAKFGIHQFDQNHDTVGCGDMTGPLRIYNNVIVNQGGAAISIGCQCGWTMDAYIENNIIINSGLRAAWNGIDPNTSDGAELGGISIRDSGVPPDGGLLGTMHVRNNLVYNWGDVGMTSGRSAGCFSFQGSADNVKVNFSNNICYSDLADPIVAAGYQSGPKLDNINGSHNLFYYSTGQTINQAQVARIHENSLVANPLIRRVGATVSLEENSPAISAGIVLSGMLPYDIYGNPRGGAPSMGPLQGSVRLAPPNPPSDLRVILGMATP